MPQRLPPGTFPNALWLLERSLPVPDSDALRCYVCQRPNNDASLVADNGTLRTTILRLRIVTIPQDEPLAVVLCNECLLLFLPTRPATTITDIDTIPFLRDKTP